MVLLEGGGKSLLCLGIVCFYRRGFYKWLLLGCYCYLTLKLRVNLIQQAKTRVHYNSDHPEFNTELNVLFKVSFHSKLTCKIDFLVNNNTFIGRLKKVRS